MAFRDLGFHTSPLEPSFHTIEQVLTTGRSVRNEAGVICVLKYVRGSGTLGEIVAHVLVLDDGIREGRHHQIENNHR